jgi:maltose alpha-D-glucosyltransferase/alpha-amylase
VLSAEQSNTSVTYGDRFILKFVRRPEEGLNPDLEIGSFLTERGFEHVPAVGGHIEYRRGRGESTTLAILTGIVHNEGDAWMYTQDALRAFQEGVAARAPELPDGEIELASLLPDVSLTELSRMEPPVVAYDTIGAYLESARQLGRRTAELHLALASDPDHPDFAPEPFSPLYLRSLYQSMRTQATRTFRTLRSVSADLPSVKSVLDLEPEILERFRRLLNSPITASRIRCHGDYHLGQVLWTGKDFVIIDFEGEPALPLGERRIKRSALTDVAGMLRSFDYAARHQLLGHPDEARLSAAARDWVARNQAAFCAGYAEVSGADPRAQGVLLGALMIDKAVYEVIYEARHRPSWQDIPLDAIAGLLP